MTKTLYKHCQSCHEDRRGYVKTRYFSDGQKNVILNLCDQCFFIIDKRGLKTWRETMKELSA